MEGQVQPYALPPLNFATCVTLKLTESNYLVWKSHVEKFLRTQKLLGFINGATPCPPATLQVPRAGGPDDTVENPDHEAWLLSDNVVQVWLQGSLSEDVAGMVLSCNTAQEMWNTLAENFNKATDSRVIDLKRRLQTITKESKSLSVYLKEIKDLGDQLASIGHPVSEKKKIFYTINGLGEKYEAIVTQTEGFLRIMPQMPYEEVVNGIKSFEDRMIKYATATSVNPHLAFNLQQSGQESEQSQQQAFYSNRGRGSGNNRGNRGRGNYSTTGRGFHQQISTNNTSQERPICQICKRTGHDALQCWHRFDKGYQLQDIAAALTALKIPEENVAAALAALKVPEVSKGNGHEWYTDTGATAHVTNSQQHLSQSKPYYGSDTIMVGDGSHLPITHSGSAQLPSTSGTIPLNDVLVCPDIAKSLLSVSKVTRDYPCKFIFDCDEVIVKDKVTKEVLTRGNNTAEGLYVLQGGGVSALYSTRQQAASEEIWHRRLGHPHTQVLQSLSSSKAILINKSTKDMCESCKLGKSSRLPFSESNFVSSRPLERIHCDLWGPSPITSGQGFRYYVVFIDNWSRFSWFYPLKTKADFFPIFLRFQQLVENQLNCKIAKFQCDGGGEFISSQFLLHLQQQGIQQLISCPHTPQQNGLAERKHRHLTELGLSMMFESKVPQDYWVEAFFTANFLSNLLPTSALDTKQSPFQCLFNKPPDYSALRVFGCACFPTLRDYAANKFDPRSLKCVFLGYNEKYKGYRCLYPPTGRVYISRHVIFDETNYPFSSTYISLQKPANTTLLDAWQKSFIFSSTNGENTSPFLAAQHEVNQEYSTLCIPSLIPVSREPHVESQDSERTISHQESPDTTSAEEDSTERTSGLDPVTIGDSIPLSVDRTDSVIPENAEHFNDSTTSQVPQHPMVTRLKAGIVKPNPRYILLTEKVSYPEPKTVAEALEDEGWNDAMGEEIGTCHETGTWSLEPYTPDMNVLGCKWVFRVKLKADGSLDKLKARLVAQGFDQEEGIDYLETYSPVVRTATVRGILHTATIMNWDIKQLDVKNAFLHGELQEVVYMKQPAGFVDKDKPNHVCRLHKAIYGLKQAPRAWFDKFSTYLIEFGFECSKIDPSLFVYCRDQQVMFLLLYVDDMVLTGNNQKLIDHLLEELSKEFRMKDLGQFEYFLGIQATHLEDGLFLSQQKYAEDLLAVAGMSSCTSMPTPLPLDLKNTPDQEKLFPQPTYFRSLAGKLQYLTMTRPDIQFAVNYVCQKMHAPSQSDFNLLRRVLRYVKGTVDYGIKLSRDTTCTLAAYSDSDWAGCNTTRRSTGGYCSFFGNNIISWSSQKQQSVSRSSTEAEYRAMSEAAAEITWLQNLLRTIGIPQPDPAVLYCDNLSASYLSANPKLHKKSKHIETHYHYVREKVALGSVVVTYIPSASNLADIFTKSLPQKSFCDLRYKLGVDKVPTPSLKGGIRETQTNLKMQSISKFSQSVSKPPSGAESLSQIKTQSFDSAIQNEDKKGKKQSSYSSLKDKNSNFTANCGTSNKIMTTNRFNPLRSLIEC